MNTFQLQLLNQLPSKTKKKEANQIFTLFSDLLFNSFIECIVLTFAFLHLTWKFQFQSTAIQKSKRASYSGCLHILHSNHRFCQLVPRLSYTAITWA